MYIPPGETRPVKLGIQIRPAQGTWLQLEEVSSFVIKKPNLVLRGKIIDPGYTGELMALFLNVGNASRGFVSKGERVAQLVTRPFRSAPCLHVQQLPKTKRGASAGWARAMDEVFAISEDENDDNNEEDKYPREDDKVSTEDDN